MRLQRLLADDEVEAGEEAKGNLEARQLRLADAADARKLAVRVRQVLERLHGHAQAREHQPVRVAPRHGDGALLDGEPVNVQRRRQVHGRAHRAELVQPQQILLDADGRLVFAVKLARDGAVLQVDGLRVGADDDVWRLRRLG